MFEAVHIVDELEQNVIEQNNNDESTIQIVECLESDYQNQFSGDSAPRMDQSQIQTLEYHKMILNKLEEISARLDVLEKRQDEAVVERRLSSDSAENYAGRNFNILSEYSLPAKSKDDLEKLEFELLKPEVKQSVVSILFHL